MTLDDLAARVAAALTPAALWQALVAFAVARGIPRVSYHHYLPGEAAAPGAGLDLRSEGFPRAWVCRYLEARLYEVDPIPAAALNLPAPFRWTEVQDLIPVTPEGADYLRQMAEAGLGDGLAVAVFGPQGRNGYVGLGYAGPVPPLSAAALTELQAAAQLGHLAYCALVAADATRRRPLLSPREREVLDWIARGKSNAVIAQILGVSPHTVGTLVRRIFAKLGVHDRVSAAILGQGAGRLPRGRVARVA
ncbi:MAG: autoinducer binding domain-containing protein [Gemmobacter sp.]